MENRYPEIRLFSGSPQRKALLERLDVPFEVCPVDADETLAEGASFTDAIKAVAGRKLREGLALYGGDLWGLAADTLVESGGRLLGKPLNRSDARDMLWELSGKSHVVHTAFCVYSPETKLIESRCCTTEVVFRELSDFDIEYYVESGEWADAAGSYRIQALGEILAESINGLWSTVVGLPLGPVYGILLEMGYFKALRQMA